MSRDIDAIKVKLTLKKVSLAALNLRLFCPNNKISYESLLAWHCCKYLNNNRADFGGLF
jgi:hypothetical protein